MTTINIVGINKAKLLVALFNNAFQQGMGVMHADGRAPLSLEDATELLKKTTYFDYLRGRVMKVDIGKDELFTATYNRDVGFGEAERIVAQVRAEG